MPQIRHTLIVSLQQKYMRMNVGKEFEFKGIPLRAEREMSDLSCDVFFQIHFYKESNRMLDNKRRKGI